MYALAIQKAGIFAVVGNAPRSRGKDVPGRRVIVVCANVAVRPEHLPYVFRQIQFVRAQNRPVRFENAGTSSGSVVPANPLQWSSEIYDSELDLVYYNYRHYSPALGRFLSRDPIEEQGGLNLYAFVGNDSVQKTDYRGGECMQTGNVKPDEKGWEIEDIKIVSPKESKNVVTDTAGLLFAIQIVWRLSAKIECCCMWGPFWWTSEKVLVQKRESRLSFRFPIFVQRISAPSSDPCNS